MSDAPRLPEPDDPRELPPQPERPARASVDWGGSGLGWVALVLSVVGFVLVGLPAIALVLGGLGIAGGVVSFMRSEPGKPQYPGGVAVIVGGAAIVICILAL